MRAAGQGAQSLRQEQARAAQQLHDGRGGARAVDCRQGPLRQRRGLGGGAGGLPADRGAARHTERAGRAAAAGGGKQLLLRNRAAVRHRVARGRRAAHHDPLPRGRGQPADAAALPVVLRLQARGPSLRAGARERRLGLHVRQGQRQGLGHAQGLDAAARHGRGARRAQGRGERGAAAVLVGSGRVCVNMAVLQHPTAPGTRTLSLFPSAPSPPAPVVARAPRAYITPVAGIPPGARRGGGRTPPGNPPGAPPRSSASRRGSSRTRGSSRRPSRRPGTAPSGAPCSRCRSAACRCW